MESTTLNLFALIAYCNNTADNHRTNATYHSLRGERTEAAYHLGMCHAYQSLANRFKSGEFTLPPPQ